MREGKKACDFAVRQFEHVSFIILRSTRSDKYDRYLAGVFYSSKDEEKFISNELLAKRLAIRMDG